MTILSLLPTNYSGFLHQGTPFLQSKFPTRIGYHHRDGSVTPQMICKANRTQKYSNNISTKSATFASKNDQQYISYDDSPEEPILLTLIKESLWALKSLFVFLIEQPSQLKYIEWPSFSNTLRTATLTLVIVAFLLVALSSVDSALSYLLNLALRKST
ncbi:uncharacterized protein LOC127120092 [Lathyrus oleraceus]|uniref:Uncharacterized protein n=1 Tax=Pisum sativum TaxID=3888 RepID=A0A9D5BF98_PEA|nr:uncharacterized protein LOC127120092 [Pisum sativum]XP_050906437.1 uncharacterized protein LOC127120092 [Pisum sativum]XP_050906444.1 uncharacterized protein LOC127120092 [Pisum sativum]KAI5442552.1 hypothetical protein KIW84_011554 [Pisum sativum]